jgi:hypothetical protein
MLIPSRGRLPERAVLLFAEVDLCPNHDLMLVPMP